MGRGVRERSARDGKGSEGEECKRWEGGLRERSARDGKGGGGGGSEREECKRWEGGSEGEECKRLGGGGGEQWRGVQEMGRGSEEREGEGLTFSLSPSLLFLLVYLPRSPLTLLQDIIYPPCTLIMSSFHPPNQTAMHTGIMVQLVGVGGPERGDERR